MVHDDRCFVRRASSKQVATHTGRSRVRGAILCVHDRRQRGRAAVAVGISCLAVPPFWADLVARGVAALARAEFDPARLAGRASGAAIGPAGAHAGERGARPGERWPGRRALLVFSPRREKLFPARRS